MATLATLPSTVGASPAGYRGLVKLTFGSQKLYYDSIKGITTESFPYSLDLNGYWRSQFRRDGSVILEIARVVRMGQVHVPREMLYRAERIVDIQSGIVLKDRQGNMMLTDVDRTV